MKKTNIPDENAPVREEFTAGAETAAGDTPTVQRNKNRLRARWRLAFYDVLVYAFNVFLILWINPSEAQRPSLTGIFVNAGIGLVCIFVCRYAEKVYHQIWRYGGIQSYIRLLLSDAVAFWAFYLIEVIVGYERIPFIRLLALVCMNLLASLAMRMVYRYAYKGRKKSAWSAKLLNLMLVVATGNRVHAEDADGEGVAKNRIKIAIVGAGRVGVGLAEELINNSRSVYTPRCFVDCNPEKTGRMIYGIPVLAVDPSLIQTLAEYEVQEIVFALPETTPEERKKLYNFYKQTGCKIKIYDYPTTRTADTSKRTLREFDIEELLFREPINFSNEKTEAYYRGKVVMITGGGGSIGSELCRQIAKMQPEKLVILDVYENSAYDIQQELKLAYKNALDVCVEIVTVCDRRGLEQVFRAYHPQIVIHAAAHKHVPLMEHNCCEAVKNNVFGTLNTVELSEKYHVEHFLMVSTDKAVNPTNVMGSTKRMCEMIVQCHSRSGSGTVFTATRFGNVLGSAGSVIPLFRRQIKNGGPLTLTDKRIIRYFMTISEASQLVLESGSMAKNGELFVLDMGKPVKILDLAENMIRMSGYEPYVDIDIIETGLRPGEKLYEELLIRSDTLTKTDNSLIFVEKDTALSAEEIDAKLDILRRALETDDNETVKMAMRSVVPTFKDPDEVNAVAANAIEMRNAADHSIFSAGKEEKIPARV